MAILNYTQNQADPWGKQGTAAANMHDAGNVYKQYSLKNPRCVSPSLQPVYVDVCTCCGADADLSAFLADQGNVKLCMVCAWALGINTRGQNAQELPY